MEPRLCTLITGATSSIGKSIATLLSQNRNLILHGRDLNRLTETLNGCAHPESHQLWSFDLSAPEHLQKSLPEFLREHQLQIDSLVHCAGILKVLPMRQLDLTQAREIMAVNFHSAAEIIRLLLMKPINNRQLKNIIFISSIASKFGAKVFNHYGASKGALDALMRSLSVELAPEIRVNSILPGGIRTERTESMFTNPELEGRLDANYPLGPGLPTDIASCVEFLLSDHSRWITGQQLVVDGGRTSNISA